MIERNKILESKVAKAPIYAFATVGLIVLGIVAIAENSLTSIKRSMNLSRKSSKSFVEPYDPNRPGTGVLAGSRRARSR